MPRQKISEDCLIDKTIKYLLKKWNRELDRVVQGNKGKGRLEEIIFQNAAIAWKRKLLFLQDLKDRKATIEDLARYPGLFSSGEIKKLCEFARAIDLKRQLVLRLGNGIDLAAVMRHKGLFNEKEIQTLRAAQEKPQLPLPLGLGKAKPSYCRRRNIR